ncbi:MAG: VRR-NUC domain-containing protein [Solirubrobacterales bacterium]
MIAETIIRKSAPSERTEHQEQARLFKWAKDHEHEYGGALRMLYAIPNGGLRDDATAARLKREGVRRGVPDVCLPVARRGCNSLYIEMKKTVGGTVSPEQREWRHWLSEEDHLVATCYGADAAIEVIKEYLGPAIRSGTR